jgi:hypothetical protein
MQREGDLDVQGKLDLDIDADRLLVPIPDLIQALRDTSLEAREFYRRDGWGEYLLISERS